MAFFKNIPYELVLGWRYTRAGRATRRNGFISFISGVSMMGIGLGVAALIIVLSVMNGFQKEVRDRMLGVVSHIEVYAADGAAVADLPALLARLKANPQVQGAAPFITAQALLARGEDMKGVLVRGIDPALEPEVSDLSNDTQAGVLQRLLPGEFSLVLGRDLANNMFLQSGDPVTLVSPSGQVTPAGVLPRMKQMGVVGTFSSGHYEYDSALALMHVEDAARMFRLDGPSGVRLKLRDLHLAREVARDLQLDLGPQFFVRDWTQQNRTWFAAVQVEKRMMFIILTLIVAVAAFNLVSTLVMTVTDKRADIAILRTLGASPRSIMGIFVVQGATVGVIGTMSGLALGLLVAFNIDVIVPALETLFNASFLPRDIYLISRMPSEPLASDIWPVAIISLVLAFVATLYPSWRASQVNPAEALRYEYHPKRGHCAAGPGPDQAFHRRPSGCHRFARRGPAGSCWRNLGHRGRFGLGQEHLAAFAGRAGRPNPRLGAAQRPIAVGPERGRARPVAQPLPGLCLPVPPLAARVQRAGQRGHAAVDSQAGPRRICRCGHGLVATRGSG